MPFSIYGGIGPAHGSYAGKEEQAEEPLVLLTARACLVPVSSAQPALKSPARALPALKPQR